MDGADTTFRGRFNHTIDPKGRLSIPARFREILRERFDDAIVMVPWEGCLLVYPTREWAVLEKTVADSSPFDLDARKLRVLFLSRGRDATIDQAGRILIPPEFRTVAGLTKDVTIVGGLKLFEVWDRARLDHFDVTNWPQVDGLFRQMVGRGD